MKKVFNVKSKTARGVKFADTVQADVGENAYIHYVVFNSPSEGNGGVYTQDYWQSVIDLMIERDKPLSGGKTGGNGHEGLENDFFIVGAKHDRENEKVYFKIAVPEMGFSSSNEGLIRSLKNGVGEFSIVAHVEPRNENGITYFDKELGLPRIDFVDVGAMAQAQYNSKFEAEKKLAEELAKMGLIDYYVDNGNLIHNGRVSKVWAVKNQNGLHKAFSGRLLNTIAKAQKNKQEQRMEKEEILKALKNLISTGEISAEELDEALKINRRTNADDEALAILGKINEILGLIEPTKDEIFATIEQLYETMLDAEADEVAETDEKENSAWQYARKEIKNGGVKNLRKIKEGLKSDKVFLTLKNQQSGLKAKNTYNVRRWGV